MFDHGSSARARPARARLGRPRQVEDEAVFAAIRRLLVRAGWAHLTVGAVAREVGVTPGALLQRFGGKRGLLLAMSEWSNARMRAGFAAGAVRPGGSSLEALRGLVAAWVADWTVHIERPEQIGNILSAYTELGDPEQRR